MRRPWLEERVRNEEARTSTAREDKGHARRKMTIHLYGIMSRRAQKETDRKRPSEQNKSLKYLQLIGAVPLRRLFLSLLFSYSVFFCLKSLDFLPKAFFSIISSPFVFDDKSRWSECELVYSSMLFSYDF